MRVCVCIDFLLTFTPMDTHKHTCACMCTQFLLIFTPMDTHKRACACACKYFLLIFTPTNTHKHVCACVCTHFLLIFTRAHTNMYVRAHVQAVKHSHAHPFLLPHPPTVSFHQQPFITTYVSLSFPLLLRLFSPFLP